MRSGCIRCSMGSTPKPFHAPSTSPSSPRLSLSSPFSISGIGGLLGVELFVVLHVLVPLQALHLPTTYQAPVTLYHTSLRDFLKDESRSGRTKLNLYASPTHHLPLSYHCFVQLVKRNLYGPLSNDGNTPALTYCIKSCVLH